MLLTVKRRGRGNWLAAVGGVSLGGIGVGGIGFGGLMAVVPAPGYAQAASQPNPGLESRVQSLETMVQQLQDAIQRITGSKVTVPGPPPGTAPPANLETRVKALEGTVRQLLGTLQQIKSVPPAGQAVEAPSGTAPSGTVPSGTVPSGTVPSGTVTSGTSPTGTTPAHGVSAQKPRMPAAAPEGFYIQSPDGNSRLRVHGYVQADARYFSDDNGQTGPSSFYLRRVRSILDGTLYNQVDFRIMPDFGEGKVVIQDAYGEIRFAPGLRLRVGKFKPPVSLERLQSGADLQFVDRSIANNLVPNRDLGVQLSGDLGNGIFTYAFGIFNGVADGTSSDGDAGEDKDIAGRIFAQPLKNSPKSALQGLGFGVGISNGSRTESLSSLGFKTAGRSTWFKYDPAVVGAGSQLRVVPHLSYYNGPFSLFGEYITSHERAARAATRLNLDFQGYVIQGGWVITGEKASFQGVNPAKPFGLGKDNIGALELAARYSAVTLGNDVFFRGLADPATSASDVHAATIGLNWYLNRGAKLKVNYEHTDFNRAIKFSTGNKGGEDTIITQMQLGF